MPDPKTYSEEEYNTLQTKLESAEERSRRFEGKLTDIEKGMERFKGIDPDEFHALKQANEQLQREKAQESPEDLDAWKAQTEQAIRGDLQKTIDEKEERIKGLQKTNHELQVIDRAMTELQGRFTDDSLEMVKQIYIRPYVDRDDSGAFVIKDKDGNVRYAAGQSSVKMSLSDFAAEIAKNHPSIAKAEGSAGSKMPGQKVSNNGTLKGQYTYEMYKENRESIPASERHKLAMENLKKSSFRH